MSNNKLPLDFEEEFRDFLYSQYDNPRVVSDAISRCKRVQNHEGNLLVHYKKDQCKDLIDKLSYSLDDVNHGRLPLHSVSIQGKKGLRSVYEGTQSLNHAVTRYVDFMHLRTQGNIQK